MFERLTKQRPSIPFNPLVSNALFRSGYIEAWGRGTINMINECAKRSIPPPKYKYDYSGFIVEFRSKDVINEGVNEGVNILIEIVRKNPGLKAPAIAQKANKGLSTIERYLKQLKEANIVEFRGVPKTGGYYLVSKEKTSS